jgi:hypothetical protein
MKITKHIAFHYNVDRMKYINRIINETNTYEIETDIYIHTNNHDLTGESFANYNNGILIVIHHTLEDPFMLTWKCRDFLREQQNDYDIFIYIEDDMLIPYKAINYWLQHNEQLIKENYNLGFLRIEIKNNEEYITDLHGEKLDSFTFLDGKRYCVNNKNAYCAFWIYNKNEFHRFVNSKYYYHKNIPDYYSIREKSAIGLHGHFPRYWYKDTLIPMVNNKLDDACKIYHMPNNYVTDNTNLFATIKFINAIKM